MTADLELRWFDYWLKGLQNGIMSEPAVRESEESIERRSLGKRCRDLRKELKPSTTPGL